MNFGEKSCFAKYKERNKTSIRTEGRSRGEGRTYLKISSSLSGVLEAALRNVSSISESDPSLTMINFTNLRCSLAEGSNF